MTTGLNVNGAGVHDYEDVNPVADENEKTEEEILSECEEEDFTGADDELGYANDR